MTVMPTSSQNSDSPHGPKGPSGRDDRPAVNSASSFSPYQESKSTRRLIIGGGIALLIITVIAVVITGFITMNRQAPESKVAEFPSSADVDTEVLSEVTDIIGTYSGDFHTAIAADDKASTWTGAVSLTGNEGLLVYPGQGCQVFLSEAELDHAAVKYKANPLNSKCNPTGTWSFTKTTDGLIAEYVEDGEIIVAANLEKE